MFTFLASWSWWLLGILYFLASLIAALGIFGRGRKRDIIAVSGGALAWGLMILQWYVNGLWAAIAIAVLHFIWLKDTAHYIVLRWLGKRGVVHPDPDIAREFLRAEVEMDKKRERMMKQLRAGTGFQALQEFGLAREEAEANDQGLLVHLESLPIFREYGVQRDDLERLSKLLFVNFGAIQPKIAVKIMKRRSVLEAYVRWRASDFETDSELLYSIAYK